jgi:hypothetical protein
MRKLLLPLLILTCFTCGSEVDHVQREQHARSYAAPLGRIEALSCQHSGMDCANEMNTSCTVILEDVGVLTLNCSNKGCEAIGIHRE